MWAEELTIKHDFEGRLKQASQGIRPMRLFHVDLRLFHWDLHDSS